MTEDEQIFKPIHSLLRKKRYNDVLRLIYDKKSGRIKLPYSVNLNHGWYVIGDIHYRMGRFRDAMDAFRKSLNADKKDAQALWAIANCYSALQSPSLAERYLRKALRLASTTDRPKITYDLGNALFDQKKYPAALKEYKTVKNGDREVSLLAKKNAENAKRRIKGSRG